MDFAIFILDRLCNAASLNNTITEGRTIKLPELALGGLPVTLSWDVCSRDL